MFIHKGIFKSNEITLVTCFNLKQGLTLSLLFELNAVKDNVRKCDSTDRLSTLDSMSENRFARIGGTFLRPQSRSDFAFDLRKEVGSLCSQLALI